jgi:hypothetical protein
MTNDESSWDWNLIQDSMNHRIDPNAIELGFWTQNEAMSQ